MPDDSCFLLNVVFQNSTIHSSTGNMTENHEGHPHTKWYCKQTTTASVKSGSSFVILAERHWRLIFDSFLSTSHGAKPRSVYFLCLLVSELLFCYVESVIQSVTSDTKSFHVSELDFFGFLLMVTVTEGAPASSSTAKTGFLSFCAVQTSHIRTVFLSKTNVIIVSLSHVSWSQMLLNCFLLTLLLLFGNLSSCIEHLKRQMWEVIIESQRKKRESGERLHASLD